MARSTIVVIGCNQNLVTKIDFLNESQKNRTDALQFPENLYEKSLSFGLIVSEFLTLW
jgi:hypothetical protein